MPILINMKKTIEDIKYIKASEAPKKRKRSPMYAARPISCTNPKWKKYNMVTVRREDYLKLADYCKSRDIWFTDAIEQAITLLTKKAKR